MNHRAVVAVGVSTAGFATALGLREVIDPWLSTAASALVGIALSAWALGPRLRGLFAITGRGLAAAAAVGVALVVATHAAYRVTDSMWPTVTDRVRVLYATIAVGHARLPLVALTLVVVVAEEMIWRGAALELFPARRAWFAPATVVLYALPQALAGAWLLVAAALGVGSLFLVQRIITSRLTDSIVTHAVWSIAIFVVIPLGA